jgi:glucosamine--fructose-6-phosphate aminotransferase (isomerizing)
MGEGRAALQAAVELLAKKKRVVVTGMGASLFAGIGFAYALSSRGWSAQTIEASELLYYLDAAVDADTAVVLVSRSGESIEVTRLLKKLKRRGSATIGLMNVRESSLGREVDQPIFIASPPDEFIAIQTYTGTLATFALLQAALRQELSLAAEELDETAELLSHWIPECVRAREAWDSFLGLSGPCYLLGRGANLGSVAEGVLLMHETAKCPAVGMSIAQFRHGPVEAVDVDFHAIVLGTQVQTAELDLAFANDLLAMNGTVRWLGAPVVDSTIPHLCAWPNGMPKTFGAVLETIPLQVLAYRKAELMGISPGKFRWAPQVTTSESGFLLPQAKQ